MDIDSRYRVNHALSFGWQSTGLERPMSFTARDPLSNQTSALVPDEFWLAGWLNDVSEEEFTTEEMVASAAAFSGLPRPVVEATLARLRDLLFVDSQKSGTIDRGLEPWERLDCKLAFEFLAQSLDERARSGDGQWTDPKKDCANPPAFQPLPAPAQFPPAPLAGVLYGRRTCRKFNGRLVEPPVLSSLLYRGLACLPPQAALSAALYHLIVLRAGTLEPGVYVYDPASHGTHEIRRNQASDLESALARMLIGQRYVEGCAFALLLSVDTRALFTQDPRPSALRRWMTGAGIVAQRLIAFGGAHGLRSFLSAAIAERHATPITGCQTGGWRVPMHCLAFGYSDDRQP